MTGLARNIMLPLTHVTYTGMSPYCFGQIY